MPESNDSPPRDQSEPTRDSEAGTGPRRAGHVGLLVLLGLVALTVLVAAVGSIPAVCSLCHASQTEAMAKEAHGDTWCYGCHLENGLWGVPKQKAHEFTRMYPLALIGAGLKNPATPTSRAVCLQCHADVLRGVSSAEGTSINHRSCAPGPTCDVCHGTVAHGRATRWPQYPAMEECVACHQRTGVPVECETCHTSDQPSSAGFRGPWQITHGTDWEETHGMGDLGSCGTCHPGDYCSKCHGVTVPHPADFGATHGAQAIEDPAACAVCHKSQEDFCDVCHTIQMPHPAGFLKQHNSLAKGDTDPACLRCHVQTDCEQCHANHIHPGGSQGVPVPWTLTPEALRQ